MKDCFFTEVSFYVSNLQAQRSFFISLKYTCTEILEGKFEVTIGRSKLIYHASKVNNIYHYCILIDPSQIEEKFKLLRALNLEIETFEEKEIIHNSSWNSDSLYFTDPNGGMPEFIVHHSIKGDIDQEQLAEVAMAVHDTDDAREKLNSKWNLSPYKGTSNRFYDIGFPGSMFIIIDPVQKPLWFPYNYNVSLSVLRGNLLIDGKEKTFECRDGVLLLD